MHRSTLQGFNGCVFLAQLLTLVGCFVAFLGGSHELQSSGSWIRFYWDRSETRNAGSADYSDHTDNHAASQCRAGGIVLLLFCIASLLVLVVNLFYGVVRVMEIPEQWLRKYMNTDMDWWIKREAMRVAAVLLLYGIAMISWGATCIRSSVDEFGAATAQRPSAKLVLTGYIYELICWFLLLLALGLYWPIWSHRHVLLQEGSMSRMHAVDDESGSGIRGEDGRGGPLAGGRRSSMDGGIDVLVGEQDGKYTHPDSIPVQNGHTALANSTGTTLAQLQLVNLEEQRRTTGGLHLDHVLKVNGDGAHPQPPQPQQPRRTPGASSVPRTPVLQLSDVDGSASTPRAEEFADVSLEQPQQAAASAPPVPPRPNH